MILRLIASTGIVLAIMFASAGADDSNDTSPGVAPATSVEEARARARILHEAFHGALQVMHRDFFDEDDARVLPSGSLEDVFEALQHSYDIQVRWLAVNAKAMNIDHEANSDFEKQAVAALASGKKEYELVTTNEYLHAGTIRLASQCLKCHLPQRTSTADRAAGLSIRMPLNMPPKQATQQQDLAE